MTTISIEKPRRACIFCDKGNLSATHIWPNWLHKMYPGKGDTSLKEFRAEYSNPHEYDMNLAKVKFRQNGLFTMKPRVACVECNTGWMNDFEEEVRKFIKPVLKGEFVSLSLSQSNTLAGWLGLIMFVADAIDPDGIQLSKPERIHFRKQKKLPLNFSIFIAGYEGDDWFQAYVRILLGAFIRDNLGLDHEGIEPAHHCHLVTFCVGKLFIQVYRSPILKLLMDYDISTRATGLTQIWPPKRERTWPFKKRSLKFPLKLTLNDEEADRIGSAFAERTDRLRIAQGSLESLPSFSEPHSSI